MKITRRRLRQLIKEAFESHGQASGNPILTIASDFLDRHFNAKQPGAIATSYDNRLENRLSLLGKSLRAAQREEKQDIIIEYIMEYSPEEFFEPMIEEFEKAGYRDPGETGDMDTYDKLSALIEKKLRAYYTPEKIKQLTFALDPSQMIR